MIWRPDQFPTIVVLRSPVPERAEKEKCEDSYGEAGQGGRCHEQGKSKGIRVLNWQQKENLPAP